MKILTLILSLILITPVFASVEQKQVTTVPYLDVERYMGKWFEVASYPQWFQKGCTATTAEYSLKKNGEVKVVNTCRKNSPNGKLKVAKARAWVKDSVTNSKLKVQFFLKFCKIPFFSGDYWVIMLDEVNYSYAVVSDPKMKTLWILSRTQVMEEELYNEILVKLENKGYDLTKLKKTIF